MPNDDLKALIRTIPGFPRPGIRFRDITTLLLDPKGFAAAIERLACRVDGRPDLVAGIEARGFVVAAALAQRLGSGVLLIRKDGKLPGATIAEDYALEYGTDRLAMHVDACTPGRTVLIADDLLATGGTALAAARLIRRAGGVVTGAVFIVDLPDLGGGAALREAGIEVHALIEFEGDRKDRNPLLYRGLTVHRRFTPRGGISRLRSVFSGESLMSFLRLRAAALVLAAGLGLAACSYDRGYGYYGVGYNSYCDPYWGDCYYGGGYGGYAYDPWWGWYGNYYYPGIGIYVFDRWGRRHRWSDDHRRYWEGRRHRWGDRDWNDRRWERWDGYRGDRGDWRRGRGDRSDWRDRSQRQDWNENPRSFRREGMRQQSTEPRVRSETRTEGTRSRGEWRGRTEGRGGWRGRRGGN